uniref:RNase H family protein n=1 Tax=Solanum tuberosum TaxID=4113 RepID=M0ZKZ3_SOLTU
MENNIWLNLKMAIKLAFPTFEMADSWKNFSETVEHLRHTTEWEIIKWIKPTTGKVKLNTDRSFSKNGAGIGGIVRNEYGICGKVDCDINNKEEAKVAKYGIEWCSQNGLTN